VRRAVVGALVVVAVVSAAAATVVVLLRGGESDPAASSVPSAAPAPSATSVAVRVAGLADVEVHRGDKATIRYRVVADAGTTTAVTLLVTDSDGTQVKARRLADDAPIGREQRAAVLIDLPPGSYTYTLRCGDSAATPSPGPPSAGTAAAALRVLKPLPPGFPGTKAVVAATRWLEGRDGDVAFAVVDTNGKDAGGLDEHRTFQAASLAKAILLVAVLRDDPTPDASTVATLTRMIEESDNGAAYTIFGRVESTGMRAVAKAAGMDDYEQGSSWIDTRLSASDQARFFFDLEALVPAAGRGLARRLLSGITPMQRWGIPAAAGPAGWTTYFKGGWLGMDNKLMIQAAWLEKGKKRWALAVMSDENPTRSYGWDTQKGVTGLLLGEEPTPAYLAAVLE
jgi:hypothetical protein